MTYYGLFDTPIVIHHICICSFMYISIVTDTAGTDFVWALFGGNICHHFLNIRLVSKTYGMRHTKLYTYSEAIYMTIYTCSRSVVATYTTIMINMSTTTHWFCKLCAIMVLIQSIQFMTNMASISKRRVQEYRQRKLAGTELYWFSFNSKIGDLEYFQT